MSKFKTVVKMREAIFNGVKFKDWCREYGIGCDVVCEYRELWNIANTTVTSSENWRKFILDHKILPTFNDLLTCLDEYYQEGFGTYKLDEVFKISRSAVQELLNQAEG